MAQARAAQYCAVMESGGEEFRSGDALFAFGADLRILSWNRAAEDLTGISAEEAVGRPCWQVLGGVDEGGALVCHAGCSGARLAREGWPVSCQELSIKTGNGRRRVAVSTITARDGDSQLFLHLLRDGLETPAEDLPAVDNRPPPSLTPRQLEVLRLLAEGLPAKVVSSRLGIAEATVRNHIRAILLELGCHSQLETLSKARRLGLL